MLNIKDIGEFGLIKRLSKRIKTDASVVSGIGDDAAIIKWNKDKYLLVTADMLIEGRHFLKGENPQKVGHKALAVSLSDIAAMGGLPKYALVSLGLPGETSVRYVDSIYQGIIRLAKKFSVNIVGGDTNRADKLIIDVTVLGEAEKEKLISRNGAEKGDLIFVSGRLGGSLKSSRHLEFMPKIRESQYLVNNFKLNSMIDVSDGLIADLGHILKKSKAGAVIYQELIPQNEYSRSLQDALYSGEDFELLFTLPFNEARRLKRSRRPKDMQFFLIGKIVSRPGISLLGRDFKCRRLKVKGFQHF